MKELDEELWKLGILAKTKHNEVAPSQHELAPIFSTTNIAADHNQLTMEVMKKVARKHGLACLLHEKPFDGINGSGKHNNWSITTNTGVNLLEPGKSPYENAQFLLFLSAAVSYTHLDVYKRQVYTSISPSKTLTAFPVIDTPSSVYEITRLPPFNSTVTKSPFSQ